MEKIEVDFSKKIAAEKEDHEVSMALIQLMKIADQSARLVQMMRSMPDDTNIMAWAQDKISKSEHFIEAVYD